MKSEVTAKGTMTSAAAIAILEDLLASLKSGRIVVQNGDKFVTVKPTETIEIEIGAARKKGREKVFFEMSWLREIPVLQSPMVFTISSEEPVVEEPVMVMMETACDDSGCVSEMVEISVAPEEKASAGRKKSKSEAE